MAKWFNRGAAEGARKWGGILMYVGGVIGMGIVAGVTGGAAIPIFIAIGVAWGVGTLVVGGAVAAEAISDAQDDRARASTTAVQGAAAARHARQLTVRRRAAATATSRTTATAGQRQREVGVAARPADPRVLAGTTPVAGEKAANPTADGPSH